MDALTAIEQRLLNHAFELLLDMEEDGYEHYYADAERLFAEDNMSGDKFSEYLRRRFYGDVEKLQRKIKLLTG